MLPKLQEKIKAMPGGRQAHSNDIFIALIIGLLVVFGVGVLRLVLTRQAKPEIRYEKQAFRVETQPVGERAYVASKNGKAYYTLGCAGVSRIAEQNKVFFATPLEAEQAGFARAKTCK